MPASCCRAACVLSLALLSTALGTASADERLTDVELNDTLALGEEIESRIDADLDGDGDADLAYVVSSPDARTLHVLMAKRVSVRQRYVPAGSLRLETVPREPSRLQIRKGVLTVTDASAGDTWIAATYRFRAADGPSMRLIGLDAVLSDDSLQRDGFAMSWNLLTGDAITHVLRVPEGVAVPAYARMHEQRIVHASPPVAMEDTPEAEMVMIDLGKR